MKGIFITFEGIEGSGKSTISKMIYEELLGRGISAIHTYEPGDTPLGREIRKTLLNPDHKEMEPLTEILLYLADRVEHVNKIIKPSLEKGTVVISDRFSDSTIAYQGFARGFPINQLKELDRIVRAEVKPDITILLDLDVKEGLKRNRGANKIDRFELEEVEFHERVRKGFLTLAKDEPDRFRVVDASQDLKDVYQEVKRIIFSFLGL
ncbi:MAG: dTMP kinase [Nitrospirae bacterium]|nr:dTMP kinase [Nitrospirota bacterium]